MEVIQLGVDLGPEAAAWIPHQVDNLHPSHHERFEPIDVVYLDHLDDDVFAGDAILHCMADVATRPLPTEALFELA